MGRRISFTVSFHDFDLNLQQVVNKQFEQMKLIISERLHTFVEQANKQILNKTSKSNYSLLLSLEQEQWQ
jgi:hypothetical protein